MTAQGDWLDEQWPDLKRLRRFAFLSLVLLFIFLLASPIVAFCIVALPHGWPAKSFFIHVPKSNQALVVAILISAFILPVIISCITYALIYYSVIVNGLNKVGSATQACNADNGVCDDVYAGNAAYNDIIHVGNTSCNDIHVGNAAEEHNLEMNYDQNNRMNEEVKAKTTAGDNFKKLGRSS
jgi:hypothetical protein